MLAEWTYSEVGWLHRLARRRVPMAVFAVLAYLVAASPLADSPLSVEEANAAANDMASSPVSAATSPTGIEFPFGHTADTPGGGGAMREGVGGR